MSEEKNESSEDKTPDSEGQDAPKAPAAKSKTKKYLVEKNFVLAGKFYFPNHRQLVELQTAQVKDLEKAGAVRVPTQKEIENLAKPKKKRGLTARALEGKR